MKKKIKTALISLFDKKKFKTIIEHFKKKTRSK